MIDIAAGLQTRVVATEEWHVNAPIAKDRLAPLGIPVVRSEWRRLPFREASFDLVLDRHEALEPVEVARVLRPGGTLVTQQADGSSWRELGDFFPSKTDFGDHYTTYAAAFRQLGFTVDARRHFGKVAFATLSDLAYMLLIAPWEIPDFDPIDDVDALLALEDTLRTPEGIVLTEAHYLLIAKKPLKAQALPDSK